MVPFAGYALPVQYKESILNSHHHVRTKAGLFDVSHMGQLRIHGEKRLEFLESLVPSDLHLLERNQGRLSILTNENGGIIDDCVITRKEGHVYMVINAGCKDKDLKHMCAQLKLFNEKHGSDVAIEHLGDDRALVALQGPTAANVLKSVSPADANIDDLEFMYTKNIEVSGIPTWVTRCGYTGEDGFEISVASSKATDLMNALLAVEDCEPAGLGVRDSLRLEAGLCLYGHDLNETITPMEAGLGWCVGKRRRAEGGFLGADVIQKQIKEGVTRKRVGLTIGKGAPAREDAEILSLDGESIGIVTSGTFSPTLKKPISMGYVKAEFAKSGTKVQVKVRGKVNDAEITKMPFVPSNYYRKA